MFLQEFLLIEPKQRFHPKHLWNPGGGFSMEQNETTYHILSLAKWKAVPSSPGKPYIMCVYLNNKGRIVFQYDPNSMSRLMEFPKWFENSIKHELMHVLLGHLTYRRPENYDHRKWNIACDLAINSILSNQGKRPQDIPDFWLVPGVGQYRGLGQHLSAETYYEAIKDMKTPKNDEHKLNNRAHQKRDQIFQETTKAEFVKIKDGLFVAGSGMLPGYVNQYIFSDNHDAKISSIPALETLLLRITKMKQTDFTSTRRVRNRRYPEYPGKRVDREPESVVVMIDWSQSIIQEEMNRIDQFLRAINRLFPLIYVPFTVNAEWAYAKTFGLGTFMGTERKIDGGTDIGTSLSAVYAKYPNNDQIVVLISDFCDDQPFPSIKKNVFGVYVDRLTHHINDHAEFHGKIFQI